MNNYAATYLGTRVLYTVLYMTLRGEAASYLRSATYFFSIGIPLWVLWRAGNKIAIDGLKGGKVEGKGL